MIRKKTFIHHDGALGDLLLSLPAIALIRERTGYVHLAGRADAVALLLEAGLIDEGSSAGNAKYASLFSSEIAPDLAGFLACFDNAVVFTARKDSDTAISVSSAIADTRIIVTIPPDGMRIHVSEFRLRQLRDYVGGPTISPLTLPRERVEQAGRYLGECGFDFSRPLFIIHPGSGGARKCWPIDSYHELITLLKDRCNPFFILLSGPAESEAVKAGLDAYAANHSEAVHVGGAELGFVAALISMSNIYIGNDSGISHLASCMGVRSRVFFGPTDPVLWSPLGNDVRVVQSEEECAPCGDYISRGCRERKCLSSVSPEEIYVALREFFPMRSFLEKHRS